MEVYDYISDTPTAMIWKLQKNLQLFPEQKPCTRLSLQSSQWICINIKQMHFGAQKFNRIRTADLKDSLPFTTSCLSSHILLSPRKANSDLILFNKCTMIMKGNICTFSCAFARLSTLLLHTSLCSLPWDLNPQHYQTHTEWI